MKNFVFSLITIMVLGTTVCSAKTNKEAGKEVAQRQEVLKTDKKHDARTFSKRKEQRDKYHCEKPERNYPIKKNEVTVSVQTLHF